MAGTDIDRESEFLLGLLPTDDDQLTLYKDFGSEDSLNAAIKAAIYIENQLEKFIAENTYDNESINRIQLDLSGKLNLAIGLGLKRELRGPISNVAKIRNKFAHNLHANITEIEANNLYSSFEPSDKQIITRVYDKVRSAQNSKRPKKFASLKPLERFQLMALSCRQAIKVGRAQAMAMKHSPPK